MTAPPTPPQLPPRPNFALPNVPDVTTARQARKPVPPVQKHGDVKTAEGKAAQRARNSQGTTKPARAGSSGMGLAIVSYPQLDWDEVEGEVEHVTDVAGVISHTQMGVSGNVTSQLNVPLAYVQAMTQAHMASRDGMVYIRIYKMSFDRFKERMLEQAAERAAELERRATGNGRQLTLEEAIDGDFEI